MIRWQGFVFWSWLTILFPFAEPLSAQGTRADYQRAESMARTVRQTVFRDRIKPNWIDSDHFWYRVRTGPNKFEFILVDAKQGQRRPLFDHQKWAHQLSEQTSNQISPDNLPLQRLQVTHDLQQIEFSMNGRRWRYLLAAEQLEPLATDAVDDVLLPVQELPLTSPSSETETEIQFINHHAAQVRIYWRNDQGHRQLYTELAPEQRHRQHTYVGHVWEITDLQDRFLIGFVASETPKSAVITRQQHNRTHPSTTPPAPSSHLSPDSRWRVKFRDYNVVLVAQNNDVVPPTVTGEIQLTKDGTIADAYGGNVYWAPDSSHFVVFQTQPAQSHPVHLIESTPKDRLEPRLQVHDYLKPGDRIACPQPRLFDVNTKQLIPITSPIDPNLFANPWSIDRLRWAKDSNRFTFLYNERGHQVLRIIAVDRTGKAIPLIEEQSKTFIDYHSKLYFEYLNDSDEILWMSERDGWNHLYLYDSNTGELKNQVTQGEWVVRRIEHIDSKNRQIWFYASGVYPDQDPYYNHFCRIQFDGTGFTILSEGDGTHEITFSPDRRYFLDRWSRVDQPPISELRDASDGRLVCRLEEADHSRLLETGWSVPERFTALARDGETAIYGIIIRPSHFDPNQHYPVVEKIYAGPHDAHVPKAFDPLVELHALAELGFILVQIDGMGTNWRKKAFHDVCYQNLADAGFPDRIRWIQAAAKDRPYMDLNRVGIYGGSAGGQNAMRALIDYSDFYKVAVADCGCHDNRMDKMWWNELWMGWPIDPKVYDKSSNRVHAHRLQGKLLLIVGELDRNVDPASTMQVVGALQQADKDFDLLIIVGHGHGAAGTPYATRRLRDFFVRHLLDREPRAD